VAARFTEGTHLMRTRRDGQPLHPLEPNQGRPQGPALYHFQNLEGQTERFDFDGLGTGGYFLGWWSPHTDKLLCALPGGRWVLLYIDDDWAVDFPPDTPEAPAPDDIEVTPEFASFFLGANSHVPPAGFPAPAVLPDNPMKEPRVAEFYRLAAARTRAVQDHARAAATAVAPEPDGPAVYVNVDQRDALIDGEPHDLRTQNAALFVKAVARSGRVVISFAEMKRDYEQDGLQLGGNPSEICNRLPGPVGKLIGRKEGKGYFLKHGRWQER
jgi:hypothetical protein